MNTSLKKFSSILKQEGTSRKERYVPSLLETNTLLDDRKLQDLIIYIQQYSKNLWFVDAEKNNIDYNESWEDFFVNDPVLLIANIASLSTNKIKDEYDHLSNIFQNQPSIGPFAELADLVLTRFVEIDKWYRLSPTDSLVYNDLTLYIQSYLQQEMEQLREIMLYCFDHLADDTDVDRKKILNNMNERSRRHLQDMHSIWKLSDKEKLSLRENLFKGDNEKEKLTNASIILSKTFETVFYVTGAIAERSENYFNETIYNKKNHNPHVALAITFIKLFKYQQTELNKIPQRLLHFYYKRVLSIHERSAEPDKTYVVFELAKGFDTYLVKSGTQLSAGKDKHNRELIYATDKDIVLNKAKITALRTGFIERNGNDEIANYYTDIITSTPGEVTVTPDAATATSGMFGEAKRNSVAEIGFAIASSQLYLSKGERNVVVQLIIGGDTSLPGNGNDNETIDFDPEIISLSLTGEKGWINSNTDNSGITINSLKKVSNSVIALNFSIGIAQPQAIIAFNKKLHDGDFQTNLPLMKCMLRFPSPEAPQPDTNLRIHQLNILRQVQVTGANITVQVGNLQTDISFDGVKDLILENDEAILDSKKPFYPFSAVPKVGASFYIGSSDLFYKNIQNLSINIEWLLPDNFRSYYQKYNPPYDANRFIASLGYLRDNRWRKYADVSVIDVNTAKPWLRSIKMNLKDAAWQDDKVPAYDSLKKNGTIRLKLGYPDFGHSVYPQLITSTVMSQAKRGNVDYYKRIKALLHDDRFTLELPSNINERYGEHRVIYDILESRRDDPKEASMLITALSGIISSRNEVLNTPENPDQSSLSDEENSRVAVDDENFWKKLFRVVKKVPIIRKIKPNTDKDRQDVEDVEEGIEANLYKVADFILPSKKEMNSLIINEINRIINETVTNAVDLIIEQRNKDNKADPEKISNILNEEFEKAREVINDMIAKKIAISLAASEVPPPPYSPLINAISLNYTSSRDLSASGADQLFHLTMAGSMVETDLWKEVAVNDFSQNDTAIKSTYVFPQPIPVSEKKTFIQGMLFIGIADILPDQNLSLLFQIAEDTRKNEGAPPALHWFYMRNDEWFPLRKDSLVSDGTYNLQTTGIIEFAIPGDADNNNRFFNTAALYWLCAGVAEHTDYFPLLIDVKAQATTVTFKDYENNPQHLALPLEAGKIKKVAEDLPGIRKVIQPVPSFNGKIGEKDEEYYIRVSERLRHKSRAINNWDYESLVLTKFPSLFKVKCLNNYYDGHFAVGHVTVIPIADMRNREYAGNNILLPKTNYVDLKKIEDYVKTKTSPFVKIHAINPKLEYILVKCKVKFSADRKNGVYEKKDNGFYLKKLNEDLIAFLTPWATDRNNISFSGKVYASSIINFIDKRNYIDYVKDFKMLQYIEDEEGKMIFVSDAAHGTSLVETQVTTNHSILVSAPKHQIELVEEENTAITAVK